MSLYLEYRNSTQRLWDAQDHLQMQTDFMSDGFANYMDLLTDFQVEANSPLAANILIDSGRCYLGATVSGEFRRERVFSDDQELLAITANSSGNDRIDAVIIRVDVDTEPDSQGDNVATVEVVQGTPAGSPVAPTDEAIQTSIGGDAFFRLANIAADDGFTTIGAGDISDQRASGFVKLRNTHFLIESGYKFMGRKLSDGVGILDMIEMDADSGIDFPAFKVAFPEIDTALGSPTRSRQVVTKAYVDSELSLIGVDALTIMVYGDESDGDVTLTEETTLTKDMQYGTLDLDSYDLVTDGYRVTARTITGTGKIVIPSGEDGSNGTNGSGKTQGTGGAGGAASTGTAFPDSAVGVAGGAGGVGVTSASSGLAGGAGVAGGAGTAAANSIGATDGTAGGLGGVGGTAGGGGGDAGGLGGVGGTATQTKFELLEGYKLFATNKGATFTQLTGCGGGGGGGGGHGGDAYNGDSGGGGGGGGSGSNAGYWYIAAKIMTGSWTVEAIGGVGGDGGNGANGSGVEVGGGGGGAGGAGGSGGSGVLIYNDQSAWSGSFVLTGGAGGSGGTGGSSSGGGDAGGTGAVGTTGASGIAHQIQL